MWISRNNHTFGVAQKAGVLAVHFPSADDRSLATLFGGGRPATTSTSSPAAAGAKAPGRSRCWEDCARWFAGEVIPTEDHVGFLLAPIHVESGPWPGQLGFQSVRTISPGHEA